MVAAAREAYGDLAAEDIALVLARAKAEDVATEIEGAVVVGCDSVLELDGEVHGKPADAEEAVARWRRMSGSSGCCTPATGSSTRDDETGGSGATLGATASTTVHFARLTDAEIEDYVGTGEPLRVAGVHPRRAGRPVRLRQGDPSNVVGLSLPCCASCWPRSGSPGTVFAPGTPV